MKTLIKKLLFGRENISEYQAVSLSTDRIAEKVYLKIDDALLDVTSSHWFLCINPSIFGVWIPNAMHAPITNSSTFQLYFTPQSLSVHQKVEPHATAVLTLELFRNESEKDGALLLLKTTKARVRNMSKIKQLFLFCTYYYKAKETFFKYQTLIAAYSYPRKTSLVSYQENDYFNLFPMDLIGNIPNTNRYLLGLRHSNKTLDYIVKTKKLVLCDVPSTYKTTIYKLGKHHVIPVPSLALLPFKTIPSKNFGFPVPVWANSYKEIKITGTCNLGSQLLLYGELMEGVNNHSFPLAENLFHLHFTHYASKKNRNAYPLV